MKQPSDVSPVEHIHPYPQINVNAHVSHVTSQLVGNVLNTPVVTQELFPIGFDEYTELPIDNQCDRLKSDLFRMQLLHKE